MLQNFPLRNGLNGARKIQPYSRVFRVKRYNGTPKRLFNIGHNISLSHRQSPIVDATVNTPEISATSRGCPTKEKDIYATGIASIQKQLAKFLPVQ